MSKIECNFVDSVSGTSTLTLGSSNASTIALGSGDVQSNMLYPAFLATNGSTDQSISNDANVKITLGTEVIDTDSAFSSSKFTVPSGKGGKYLISAGIDFFSSSNNMTSNNLKIYKNGSAYYSHTFNGNGNANMRRNSPSVTISMDLSASDYIELYGVTNRSDSSNTDVKADQSATFFQGFRIGT